MEYIPEARPLHILAVLLGMVLGIKAPPSSRWSTAGWAVAAVSALSFAALVARDRDRGAQWWAGYTAYACRGGSCECC